LICYPIGIVVAAYNEEEGIVPTICELKEVFHQAQLVVVDGNSSDRTLELAKDLGADVLIQQGKGKGNAISQGLDQLIGNISCVVLTDADYTYPAKYIKEMIQVLDERPEVGMVLGDRFNNRFRDDSDKNQFYAGNKFLAFTQNVLNGIKLNDPLTGLRTIRYELLKDWRSKSKGFGIEVELNYYIESKGYEIVEIPIVYRKRLGKKKLGFKNGFEIFARIVIESLRN